MQRPAGTSKVLCGIAQLGSEQCQLSMAYAILTLCRALYTLEKEEQVSKLAAARWAIDFLPEYRDIISKALIWRHERNSSTQNSSETYVLVEKFVNDMVDRFFDSEQRDDGE